jgi:hypothetical protein
MSYAPACSIHFTITVATKRAPGVNVTTGIGIATFQFGRKGRHAHVSILVNPCMLCLSALLFLDNQGFILKI